MRWWGGLPMLVGLLLAVFAPRPDMLVAGDAQTVAVRGADGLLHFTGKPKDRFAAEEWLRHDGDARSVAEAVGMPEMTCDGVGCVIRHGAIIAVARRPEALREDCGRAAVLVSAMAGRCEGPLVMIDPVSAARDGGYRITLSPVPGVLSVRESRGMRPWVGGP